MSVSQPYAIAPHGIPSELKELPTWCVWRRYQGRKIPRCVDDSRNAKLSDPSTLATFEQALAAYQHPLFSPFDGLGLFISKSDDYVCLDIDSCLTQETLTGWAADIVNSISSYTDISPSGVGVKIIAKDQLPDWINCRKSFRLQRFVPASSEKNSECLVIREGMVTLTGVPLWARDLEIKTVTSINRLCEELQREMRPAAVVSTIKSPTKLPPDSADAAINRLLKCQMPCESGDGSSLLYSLIYFMVEKWQFSDENIHIVIHRYHQRSPLKMISGASDRRSVVQTRIAQVRNRSGIEERLDIKPTPLRTNSLDWNDPMW